MEAVLARVTQHAMQYAIRSGISITTGFAVKECGRLLKHVPKGRHREELALLQQRLESKIRVVSGSIDLIELIAARGNTSLESALSLTKTLRYEIQRIGKRLEAANDHGRFRMDTGKPKTRDQIDTELKSLIQQMKLLLARIEDAVPLINLAITTSGVNLSTNLSGTISPSRLLQASSLLSSADRKYVTQSATRQQVGPTYTISLYMLFAGHASRPVDGEDIRQTTWKEVLHKAQVKLWRVPLDHLYALPGEAASGSDDTIPAPSSAYEFAYQLTIVEDLNDDRVHEDDEGTPFDDVEKAGIRDVVPIHQVSKIFYADTGKILNIGNEGDANSPVLLLKRDVHAEPPRRMLRPSTSQVSLADLIDDEEDAENDDQTEIDAQFERESAPPTPWREGHPSEARAASAHRLPADLDPEWMAFEVFTQDEIEDPEDDDNDDDDYNDDDDDDNDINTSEASRRTSTNETMVNMFSHLNMNSPSSSPQAKRSNQLVPSQAPAALQLSPAKQAGTAVRTSLSLLEMLMKLTAMQQFRQDSHLAVEDELLNFFLADSATAGAGADKQYRQRLRHNAARRVGFDPYDESPIKRRGEEYISHHQATASPRDSAINSPMLTHQYEGGEQLAYDDAYGLMESPIPRLDFANQPTILPSSPSPLRPMVYQQTPSRTSAPDLAMAHEPKKKFNTNSGGDRSSPQPLATPPSSATGRTRTAVLRDSSEPKPRSPLHEVTNDGD